MTKLSKFSILLVVLLSACATYEASNFVGFDNGAQVYNVPVYFDAYKDKNNHDRGFAFQLSKYCPNGIREISRTEAVLVDASGGAVYPGGYVPPMKRMRTSMTFACVGAPAVQEVQ